MFCKHKYIEISKTQIPSPAERLRDKGATHLGGVGEDVWFGTLVVILACEKCGKINKTEVKC